jgi:hypothetical protein
MLCAWRAHGIEYAAYQFIRGDTLSFSVEIKLQAVTQYRGRQRTDIIKRYIVAAMQQRPDFTGEHQIL